MSILPPTPLLTGTPTPSSATPPHKRPAPFHICFREWVGTAGSHRLDGYVSMAPCFGNWKELTILGHE